MTTVECRLAQDIKNKAGGRRAIAISGFISADSTIRLAYKLRHFRNREPRFFPEEAKICCCYKIGHFLSTGNYSDILSKIIPNLAYAFLGVKRFVTHAFPRHRHL